MQKFDSPRSVIHRTLAPDEPLLACSGRDMIGSGITRSLGDVELSTAGGLPQTFRDGITHTKTSN
jgi:hypothetical protein